MNKIFGIVSSRWMMIILVGLYAFSLGLATFIENSKGTIMAKELIYNNICFFVLQFLLVINFIAITIRMKMLSQKKWGVLILHYGFVIILIGAMTTYLFGVEGIVHIREGEKSSQLLDMSGKPFATLPFEIGLNDFVLKKYSGSGSPSSFESFLTIDGVQHHAYMNNVVYHGAYRIYQSSYDSDQKGSVLTVNRDLIGTLITYLGYFMLFLGMILSLIHKKSRFRRLATGLGIIIFGVVGANAQNDNPKVMAVKFAQDYAINKDVAKQFSHLMVQTVEGRIEPIDTYARELLRKMSRQTSYQNLDANQVLLSILSQAEVWSRIEFIKVGNTQITSRLKSDDDYISFVDVLGDGGAYIFQDEVDAIYAKAPNARSKYDKEVLKLDEKINILNALFNGHMLNIFPLEGDPGDHWFSSVDDLTGFNSQDSMFVSKVTPWLIEELQKGAVMGNYEQAEEIIDMIHTYQIKKSNTDIYSSSRIKAEILYNQLDIFKWTGFGYMGIGLLLIITLIISSITGKRLKIFIWSLLGVSVLLFLAQNFGMGLRWFISQRAPWTNSYESMIYVGWAAVLGGLIFVKKSKMVYGLALFLGGAILFVSNLSFMDPQITPLVPVLKSYWLIVHVAVITASYGFFGLGFLLGVASLLLMVINPTKLKSQITELTTINELGLWIGLCLMTMGTFLGAIWANESWGRYWGWDPKETWALITMLVYALILHLNNRPTEVGQWRFSALSIVALGSVLMTFFGVNYYLTGLHSYGSDSAPAALNIIWYAYSAISVLAIFAYIRYCKPKS